MSLEVAAGFILDIMKAGLIVMLEVIIVVAVVVIACTELTTHLSVVGLFEKTEHFFEADIITEKRRNGFFE